MSKKLEEEIKHTSVEEIKKTLKQIKKLIQKLENEGLNNDK